MKKPDLRTLALMGLSGGILMAAQAGASFDGSLLKQAMAITKPTTAKGSKHECGGKNGCRLTAFRDKSKSKSEPSESEDYSDPNKGNMGYHLMTDEELRMELNDEGLKLYDSLDSSGKELARKVASQRCNKANECKGLGACADDKHDCAGKNICRGQGKCAFSDKNLAVKMVHQKLNNKRQNMLKNGK